MPHKTGMLILTLLILGLTANGCGSSTEKSKSGDNKKKTDDKEKTDNSGSAASKKPVFSLAWSEYPSWSVFGVAHEKGLINGKRGQLGPIETKWGIDIELMELAYDPCIQLYSSGSCDAVCITNMDVLAPSLTRDSVAIMPTSTSIGADACIVVGISDVKELRKHKVYGLAKSVSEYCFVRNLELQGEKEGDHQFSDMQPDAAALALQAKRAGTQAIVVWNPFVQQTLKTNKDARILFDSTTIPEEIIDMVVVAKSSLQKPGGTDFAHAVVETYYEFNKLLADPAQRQGMLVALGEKFSSLDADEMEECVQKTVFYKTPDEGLGLFAGDKFPKTMNMVAAFCQQHEIVSEQPKFAFGSKAAEGIHVRFDPSFMQHFKKK